MVLSFVFGGRKYGFDFCVWCFGGMGVWNMVFSFVFRPIWVWIQIFWVLNFMFILSKSMAEDLWPKPHGWRSMAKTHLDQDLIFSLSKPRWSPGFDGHRGLIWLTHDCVLVYFINEDWLWVLVFLVFCFWSYCVLGFVCFILLLLLFWLSVLGFVSWLCQSIWVCSWFCIYFCFMVLYMFLLVWMLRKCKKREENLDFLIFWATMFLGKEHEKKLLFK